MVSQYNALVSVSTPMTSTLGICGDWYHNANKLIHQ